FPFLVSRDFRQPDARRAYIAPQRHELRHLPRGLNSLEPFIADSLSRELRQALRVRFGGLERARMNTKFEARAEAQPAQNPQVILLKAPVGIAHRADQLLREVLLALKGI